MILCVLGGEILGLMFRLTLSAGPQYTLLPGYSSLAAPEILCPSVPVLRSLEVQTST